MNSEAKTRLLVVVILLAVIFGALLILRATSKSEAKQSAPAVQQADPQPAQPAATNGNKNAKKPK